ncbi:MAG TPA: hypothetical protein VEC39_01240 [Vicinamibacterales bacterium]|nr:hypothetical protein [Vicinamibacterales bacterium]
MQVIFATCDHFPQTTADDQVLADALRAAGVDVEPLPWTTIDPYSVVDAPPVLLRSTWDYHRLPTLFRSWLQALADSGRTAWNPPAVALRNIDKIYLKDLENQGVAIPDSRWLDHPDRSAIDRAMNEQRWERAVLKPRIAATAYGTFLVDAATQLSDDDLGPARSSGALLQQYVPEISQCGEMSLVFLAGEFSHAVRKQARDGDFRVQKDYGGTVQAATPSAPILQFAQRVVDLAASECLYARVDVVEADNGPLLMELELIEPELYFAIVPEAATRMASLLGDRLRP